MSRTYRKEPVGKVKWFIKKSKKDTRRTIKEILRRIK